MNEHRAKYGPMVAEYHLHLVKKYIGMDKLRNSSDPHMNDIPLTEWDYVSNFLDPRITLGDRVCILKEAARQLLEEEK